MIEAWIYLHLAPSIASTEIEPLLNSTYLLSQVSAFLLFEIPIFVCYVIVSRTLRAKRPLSLLALRPEALLLTLVAMMVFGLAFSKAVTDGGLWFKSLGHEALAERYRELPFWNWLVFRIWEKVGIAFVALMVACLLLARGKPTKGIVLGALIISCSAFIQYVVTNSRLESLLLIAIVGVVLSRTMDSNTSRGNRTNSSMRDEPDKQDTNKPRRQGRLRYFITIGLCLLLGAYSVKVVHSARIEFTDSGRFETKWLNPLYSPAKAEPLTAWWWRLNGIDLIARARLVAKTEGIDWFGPWSYIAEITTSPRKLASAKEQMRTTAKSYMVREYLGEASPDYFSCTLTDVYGNLGFSGFPFCAFLLGSLCAWIDVTISRPRSGTSFLVAVIAAISLLRFEHELIAIASDLGKTILVTLPILIINPLRVKLLGTDSTPLA
jgi:hypothetical protein